jgi:hypothetical protein
MEWKTVTKSIGRCPMSEPESVEIAMTSERAIIDDTNQAFERAKPKEDNQNEGASQFPRGVSANVSALLQATTDGHGVDNSLLCMEQNCRLYNINGVADQIGQHQSFVRRLIRSGLLNPVAGLRRLMISETELQRFLSTTEPYTPRHRPGKKLEVTK